MLGKLALGLIIFAIVFFSYMVSWCGEKLSDSTIIFTILIVAIFVSVYCAYTGIYFLDLKGLV